MACATGARSAQGAELAHLLTGRSVVFLFLHGGPSQIETFDPKMTAPGGICSVNGEIATKLPGVTFGSSFPKLASLADRFSVVRSFQTGDGNHDIKPVVGKATRLARHATADIGRGQLHQPIAHAAHRLAVPRSLRRDSVQLCHSSKSRLVVMMVAFLR